MVSSFLGLIKNVTNSLLEFHIGNYYTKQLTGILVNATEFVPYCKILPIEGDCTAGSSLRRRLDCRFLHGEGDCTAGFYVGKETALQVLPWEGDCTAGFYMGKETGLQVLTWGRRLHSVLILWMQVFAQLNSK